MSPEKYKEHVRKVRFIDIPGIPTRSVILRTVDPNILYSPPPPTPKNNLVKMYFTYIFIYFSIKNQGFCYRNKV